MRPTVVVVGAGPAGLMLACELRLAQIETVVVERLAEPRRDSPGMAINSAVVELLDQRGLMDSLRSDGVEWSQAHFAHLFLEPARLREPHPYSFLVPQSRLEQRLAEQASRLGAEIRRGHKLVSLEQDETGVAVGIHSGARDYMMRCSYVVGCDGARSRVRRLAEIPFTGTESPFHGIVADLETEMSADVIAGLGARQCPSGMYTAGPVSMGVVRVAIGEFDVETPDYDEPATLDELRASVRRLTSADLMPGEPLWLARWENITRYAERYRNGRVFLAGDAAHVHFPLGGQGLSTGIEDAVNLGWKLAADLNGWAPAGLLDTYHTERYPVGRRACLTTSAQVALMYPMDKVGPLREVFAELLRFPDINEYLVKMVGGLDVRYPMGEPGGSSENVHPLLGRRLPGAPLEMADGTSSVGLVLRGGRGAVLDLSGAAAELGELSRWADRVDVLAAKPTPTIEAAALLLRPDGRVAWVGGTGRDPSGLTTALRTWFGEPLRQGIGRAGWRYRALG